MIALIGGAVAALIVIAIALMMPCTACKRRRERLDAAYKAWRARR